MRNDILWKITLYTQKATTSDEKGVLPIMYMITWSISLHDLGLVGKKVKSQGHYDPAVLYREGCRMLLECLK